MTTPLPPIDPEDLSQQADPERVARIWARLEPEVSAMAARRAGSAGWSDRLRLTGRPRATTWLVAASLGAMLGAGVWIGRSSAPRGAANVALPVTAESATTLDVFASGSKPRTFALPNGGSLTLDPESTVEVAELSDATIVLKLLRGTASVDGTHLAGGSVSIVAGDARMTAPAGGSMAVRRNANDVDVIAMGRPVEIDSPLGHRVIASGERLHAVPTRTTTARVVAPSPLPTSPVNADAAPAPSWHGSLALARDPDGSEPVANPPSANNEPKPSEEPADWLAKYQADNWRGALKSLDESGGASSAIDRARSPGELAILCDLMRQAKRGELSIKAAKRIVDEFPGDPSAPSFAITLANLYSQAGQPELANEYLARAGKSPLQEDVVCRQLREGSPTDPAIVSLARQYVAKYGATTSTFPAVCLPDAESIVSDADAEPKPADPSTSPTPSASSSSPSPSASSSSSSSTTSSSPPSTASSSGAPPASSAPKARSAVAAPSGSASAHPAPPSK
ncbi:MAG: hypothetical protein U0414_19985 [Polyangiaceae bacterium]